MLPHAYVYTCKIITRFYIKQDLDIFILADMLLFTLDHLSCWIQLICLLFSHICLSLQRKNKCDFNTPLSQAPQKAAQNQYEQQTRYVNLCMFPCQTYLETCEKRVIV